MRYKIAVVSFSVIIALSFSSCQTTQEATNFANDFFTSILNQDFDKAAGSVSSLAAAGQNVTERCKLMYENDNYGKLKSFEKGFGFNTSIENGIKTINLNYNMIYEKGEVTYKVLVVDRGAGYKIEGVN